MPDDITFECATCGDTCDIDDGQHCEGCDMAFCPECYIDHECAGAE